MRDAIRVLLSEGQTMEMLLQNLDGFGAGKDTVRATVDVRARPYLKHTVVGWADGPPGSNVLFLVSAQAPGRMQYRRFSVSHTGLWRCEIDAFPTPFNNPQAPLSPGIPPGASRPVSAT
jgi:hypothetical protein